jgi:hypothetical protein
MSGKKPASGKTPTTVVANDPDDLKGALKSIGGSKSDHWNDLLANHISDDSNPVDQARGPINARSAVERHRRGDGRYLS